MKKIGKWFIPDDENWPDVLQLVKTEQWTCIEPVERSFRYVKRFNKAIDVGTWIGDSTKIIHKKFSKTIGFEANQDVFECCKKNLKHLKNISLHNIALSDTADKKIFLNGPSTFSGWVNTLNEEALYQWQQFKKVTNKGKVQCRSLDSFNFRGINFLKLDADSHEGFIVKGSLKFFKRNNPVILLEYKPKIRGRQNETMPDPLILLKSIGYNIVEKVEPIDYILTREL